MRRVRAHAVVGQKRARRRSQYASYMASAAWRIRRENWIAHQEYVTGQPVCCEVCGEEDWDDLHHLTYDRMGEERHEDLVALCRPHHEGMHRAYDAWPVAEHRLRSCDAATAATGLREARTADLMSTRWWIREGAGLVDDDGHAALPSEALHETDSIAGAESWIELPTTRWGQRHRELSARANFEHLEKLYPWRTAGGGCSWAVAVPDRA